MMKLKQTMQCRIASRSRWARSAATSLGIGFFLRSVHYFGLTNLRDVAASEMAFGLIVPLALAAGLILLLKLQRPNPVAIGVFTLALTVDHFFVCGPGFANILTNVLLAATAALFLAACLGFLPGRRIVMLAGAVTVAVRLVFVDVFGYILPFGEFDLMAYIPRCAGLFTVIAIALLSGSIRMRRIKQE